MVYANILTLLACLGSPVHLWTSSVPLSGHVTHGTHGLRVECEYFPSGLSANTYLKKQEWMLERQSKRCLLPCQDQLHQHPQQQQSLWSPRVSLEGRLPVPFVIWVNSIKGTKKITGNLIKGENQIHQCFSGEYNSDRHENMANPPGKGPRLPRSRLKYDTLIFLNCSLRRLGWATFRASVLQTTLKYTWGRA